MNTRLISLLALGSLAVGCAAPRAALVTGAVSAIAGGMIVAAHNDGSGCSYDDDSCQFTYDLFEAPFDASAQAFGTFMVAGGLALTLAGLAGLVAEQREQTSAVVARADITPPESIEEPVLTLAPAPVAPAPTAAEVAIRSRPENQLALQISVIARAGQCDAAIMTSKRLYELDPDLYRELAMADPAFAQCLAHAQP